MAEILTPKVAAGRLGSARRWHPEDTEAIDAAHTDLATAQIAEAIQKNLENVPPLSDEQRAILSTLLEG